MAKGASKQFNKRAGQRVQALALIQQGSSQTAAAKATKLDQGAISRLCKKARGKGWIPANQEPIDLEVVLDKPRRGRPRKVTTEVESGNRHERKELSYSHLHLRRNSHLQRSLGSFTAMASDHAS